jgi:peptide/histidine transporter 3/4
MWGGDGDRFLDKAATVPLDYTKRSESPVYNNKKFSSNGGSSPSPSPPAFNNNNNNNNPWRLCTVTQVEEVKLLVRMLPIWVTNLMFSVVFAQVGTLFLNQGTTLDRHVSGNFEIPAASMSFFVTFSICVCLPFYDKFFVPFVRSFTTDERGLTLLQRIGVGQVISTVSIMVAAVVEMHRLRVAQSLNLSPSSISSSSLSSSVQESLPMSIFWLLPQYVLTGVCEVFISVGQMEFFLDQAPDSMRSLGSALYLSTVATGSFISSLLVSIVTKITYNENGGWIGNDLNQSHMDYFYWLLAALSIVNLAAYILCASCYTYKNNANKNFSTSELFSSSKTTTVVTLQGPRLIAAADSSDSSGPLSPTHCITVPPPPHGIDMLPLGGYKELT